MLGKCSASLLHKVAGVCWGSVLEFSRKTESIKYVCVETDLFLEIDSYDYGDRQGENLQDGPTG